MVIDDNDMIRMDSDFHLEKVETVSANVEFVTKSADESVDMKMKFKEPKLRKQVKIHHVELGRGTTGSELF